MDLTAVASPQPPKRKYSLDSNCAPGPKRMRTLSDATLSIPCNGNSVVFYHHSRTLPTAIWTQDRPSDPQPSVTSTESVSCNKDITEAIEAPSALPSCDTISTTAGSDIRDSSRPLSHTTDIERDDPTYPTPSTTSDSPTEGNAPSLPMPCSETIEAAMAQHGSSMFPFTPSPITYIPSPEATPPSDAAAATPPDAMGSRISYPEALADHMDESVESLESLKPQKPRIRTMTNQQFLKEVKQTLKIQSKWKTVNVGRRQARRILALLEVSQSPDSNEALIITPQEARKYLECNVFFPGPIITSDDQPLPLQTSTQFLNEFYDDTAKVWIQAPSVRLSRNVPREVTIAQLKARFLNPSTSSNEPNPPTTHPWNCLEMATHVEDGLRPSFLTTEDSRLLTKLKLPSSTDTASRRHYEPGWKEVEKWALLAQAGALTEPHQDSHGYGTYITLNQGIIGFGWLSNPTDAERRAWRAAPATYTGGRWRHVVLRPGQTVYFPSGTVHYVFRLKTAGDTLAFGGHVLRCSHIVRWVRALLEEQADANVTNENLTVSAEAYMERVERFVRQAGRDGSEERWGRREGVEEFLRLKGVFVQRAREMGFG